MSNSPRSGAPSARPVVFLHVGTPKSGTTYLQNMLWRHRTELREVGLCYPGECYEAHYWAALDLHRPGTDPRPDVAGAWSRLVAEVREWGGDAVISHELLAGLSEQQAAWALDQLTFAEVHLILTARDLGRQIPAAWQEEVKNRGTATFGDYLVGLRKPDRASPIAAAQAETFWRMQDLAAILSRWSGPAQAERLHLVTVPPPGADRDVLWRRFAGLLGLEPSDYATEEVRGNESLGAAEANLVRRLNLALDELDEPVDQDTYDRVVKFCLANRVLSDAQTKIRFGLPPAERDWVAARARHLVAALESTDLDVVGDLAELLPGEIRPGVHPDEIADSAVLESALNSIVDLAGQLMETRDELGKAYAELDETRRALWAAHTRPLLRRIAHRIAYRFPPLRPVLRLGVFVRDRVIRAGETDAAR